MALPPALSSLCIRNRNEGIKISDLGLNFWSNTSFFSVSLFSLFLSLGVLEGISVCIYLLPKAQGAKNTPPVLAFLEMLSKELFCSCLDRNGLLKLGTYKATATYFLWGLWTKNYRITKERAFGGECSRGTMLVPGAYAIVVLQLLSVFSTITVDLQGLWKFPFRLDLGNLLITELISAFLKFLADHPISWSEWRMWSCRKLGKSCLFFAPSDGSFCTLCVHTAFTLTSYNLESDNNHPGHSLTKHL